MVPSTNRSNINSTPKQISLLYENDNTKNVFKSLVTLVVSIQSHSGIHTDEGSRIYDTQIHVTVNFLTGNNFRQFL